MKNKKSITQPQKNNEILISIIIDLFSKEGYEISDKNIKINDDFVSIVDIIVDCHDIKKLGTNILVYTKIIQNKDYFEKNEKTKVFDIDDLKHLSIKYSNDELLNLIK